MKVLDKIKVRVEIIDIPGNAGRGIDQVQYFYDVLSICEAILFKISKIFAFQQKGYVTLSRKTPRNGEK